MFRFSTITTGLLIASLTGCSLVPHYQQPEIAMPTQWSTQSLQLHNATAVSTEWWHEFNSPELNQLMQQALSNNQTLAQAVAKINEARSTAQISGAALYPTVTLNGTAGFTNGSKTSSNATKSLFAQAAYEIDFWGAQRAASNADEALANASEFDADTAALTLTASIADTYFQLLSLKERLQLAEQIYSNADHLLTLVEAQVKYGVSSPLTLEQQRNAVANYAANIPAIQLQIDQNLHLLAVLIGQTPGQITLPNTDINQIPMVKIAPELPSTLLLRRPDIQSAEAKLKAANFNVGEARAAFFPSLSLTGKYGYSNTTFNQFFSVNPTALATASLLQPIFNAGALTGQLNYDKARVIELSAAYRQTVYTAFQEVEDALSAAYHIDTQSKHELDATVAARKAYSLAEAEYKVGTLDFLNVLTTQSTLYQAEDSYIQIHLQQLQAAVGLFRTLGGGFVTDDKTTQHLYSAHTQE